MGSLSKNRLGVFNNLPVFPPDSILGLQSEFRNDPSSVKVNLSIGVYIDESTGKVFGSKGVKKAETELLTSELNKEYLGIAGDRDYIAVMKSLVFGDTVNHDHIYGMQTVGGTGALCLGAKLIKGTGAISEVFVPKETWDNHIRIFSQAGLKVSCYPYLDFASKTVCFEKIIDFFSEVKNSSLVLLHACCHNPTGTDFTEQQWSELAQVFKEKELIPFFDFAYQGFAKSFYEDRYAVELFVKQMPFVLVASSLSKNFSLYGERIGFLGVFNQERCYLDKVASFLQEKTRGIYSSPSRRGAFIIKTIMENSDLRKDWENELSEMKHNLDKKRRVIVEALKSGCGQSFDFLGDQVGFFGYASWSFRQVEFLKKEKSIYVGPGGRFNLAGLNSDNIDYVAESFGLVHVL
ncbi:MAG: aromatic amino acid transaminase [Victivallaceae bacterium]